MFVFDQVFRIVASLQRIVMIFAAYLSAGLGFASGGMRLHCNPEGDGDLMLENAVAR